MNQNNLSSSIKQSIDNESNKQNDGDIPSFIKSALFNPMSAMQVKAWVNSNKDIAKNWRGEFGESMMHWAFLSDWTFAMDLKNIGFDLNHLDKDNRSPMDWLNDRLYASIVDESTNHHLSEGGKERLRKHSVEQIQALWSLGARPSDKIESLHPGVIWIRSGAWELLDLFIIGGEKNKDFSNWFKWLPFEGNALHAWILAQDGHKKTNFLKRWIDEGLDIDARDNNGKSPLWYAIDGFAISKKHRNVLFKSIKTLLENNADPLADDINGATPLAVLVTYLEEVEESILFSNDENEKNEALKLKEQLQEILKLMKIEV